MVVAVEKWEAEALEQVKTNGRTKPLVLSCKPAGNGVHERRPFVVKTMGAPEITLQSLRNEFLGMLLARELGLGVTGPTLVEVPGDVAVALNAKLRGDHGFEIVSGTGVGSAHRKGLVPVGPQMDLPSDAVNEAAAVYAFDLLTQNPDRSLKNPNCALHEGHVFPYDFELCFSFTRVLFGGETRWTSGSTESAGTTCSVRSCTSSPSSSTSTPSSRGWRGSKNRADSTR